MRTLILFVLLAGCATPSSLKCNYNVKSEEDATVQIVVSIDVTKTNDDGSKEAITLTASGSGVIYKNLGGLVSAPRTRVLTANHVLDLSGLADRLPANIHLDDISFKVINHSGLICKLTPIQLGSDVELNDVAVGEANCDLGPAAEIASSLPPMGSKILVTGHPKGFETVVATDGYIGGWWNGYLAVSAAIAPGNSGGPLWYNGKVIGIMVRGHHEYPHISLSVPLSSVLERMHEAEAH